MTADAVRARRVFADTVRRDFAFLKSTTSVADLHARAIVLPDDLGLLVPVCALHADDDRLIADLARWRAAHADAFPTQFPVSEEGTSRWLRAAVLDAPDRLLFLVCDRHGHAVGHLGFADALSGDRAVEVDNVVRGEAVDRPGLMAAALDALVRWGREVLGAQTTHLRVFEDNARAVAFYERAGFRRTGTIELVRTARADGAIAYVPATDGALADRRFATMVHAPAPRDEGTILTAGPSMSGREASYALDAVRHGWNHRFADYHDEFARRFAEHVGVRHALPTSSCTGALHLALAAIGIGPGDEVIVPDLTWVATANAVVHCGATPVFADVEAGGWCLDPRAFEAAITPRTKAVMPVHLYGHVARMDEIARIADAHGIKIVEDAAPSIGAELDGRRTGSFGTAAGFSFQGAKLLVTGEGGMLVTDDDAVFERAKYLWGLGHEGDFWIGATGFKYRMSNVQAAVGLGQLERADQLVEAKRRVFGWYAEELDGVPGLTLSHEAVGRSIHWMTSVLVDPAVCGVDRDGVRAALRAADIDSRPVFPAISRYPMWTARQEPGPVADRIGATGINLPSGVNLRRDEVARVGAAIRRGLASAGVTARGRAAGVTA
ncbi:MAG: perosamine synthetase [Baekduia sp.]|nr:perosamine synthetase [Baekduia sp.]